MEKWHAAKPQSIANGELGQGRAEPRDGAAAAARSTRRCSARRSSRECRRDERVDRHHRGDELRHRAEHPPAGDARALLRRRHRRAAGGAVRRRARARRARKPVAAIYSTFLQRAYDQIVHDVCLQKLPSCSRWTAPGLVGDDGPTHHGAFDIAYLRCLPNIVLMAPRDEAMLVHMLHTALATTTARSALRYPRGEAVGVPLPERARGDPDRHRRDPARGARGGDAPRRAARLRHAASARRSRPPRCSSATGSRRPSPTPASPSRSTAASSRSSPPSTSCS